MKRILLVDDDPDILEALAAVLEDSYEVEVAGNGVVALERMKGRCFDAIVLDLMMPILDGAGVMLALKEGGLTVPVLLASAAMDLEDRCQQLGAADFLSKPFDVETLEAKLTRLLGPGGGGAGQPPGSSDETPPVPPKTEPGRTGRCAPDAPRACLTFHDAPRA